MAAPRAKGNAWLTVRVIIRYQSERVTPESRMFLYGDPAWSDLDWVGTASGGLTTSPPVHPYTLPADAAGLERLDSCSWVATVRVLAGCPGMACRVRLDSAFNCGANHSIAMPATAPPGPLEVELFPFFFGRRGTTVTLPQVGSPQLARLPGLASAWKDGRDVTVFLPPSYAENEAKPYRDLLVLHDGQKFSDETWPVTLDALVLQGAMAELVVVCVPSPPDGDQRMAELTPTPGDGRRMPELLAAQTDGGGPVEHDPSGYDPTPPGFFGHLDEYLSFVTDSVLPAVARALPRVVGGGRLGSAGSSMGGLGSLCAVLKRPAVFNRGLCCAPSLWWDMNAVLSELVPAAVAAGLADDARVRLWLDTGTGEHLGGMQQATEAVFNALSRAGMPERRLRYHLDAGGFHDFNAFWRRLGHALPFLFEQEPAIARGTPASVARL
jgi:predicted alpha/beta superfamily hydrolase